MSCVCGLRRRKKGKTANLHAVEKELVVWPEDRVQKTPDLAPRPPKTQRVAPMSYCGR